MHRLSERQRGQIVAAEQFAGCMSLVYAATVALGNPHAALIHIADHSTTRGLWVAGFMLTGFVLVLLERLARRRTRFVIAIFAAVFWGLFAAQASVVGAHGAAGMATVIIIFLSKGAYVLHRSGWE